MRLIAGLGSALAAAALGFALGVLALALLPPPAAPFEPPQRAATPATTEIATRSVPDGWAPVFGVVPPPPPAPEPEPEPEPVAVEEPPAENTTYWLTGLVAGEGDDSWALISENDRGLVVRVGDTLVGGEVVTAIDAEGVWLDYQGRRELIPVQKSDLSGLVQADPESTSEAAIGTPPDLLAEVRVSAEALDRRSLERMLEAAGELRAQAVDGGTGFQIVRVTPGELFDQIGLRSGDTIVAVNGKSVETVDLLADTPDDVLKQGTLRFEIMRDGARRELKVEFELG